MAWEDTLKKLEILDDIVQKVVEGKNKPVKNEENNTKDSTELD